MSVTVTEEEMNFKKEKLLEVETVTGKISRNTLYDMVRKYFKINRSHVLEGRLRELTRKFKTYCKSEPEDIPVSLQLWLWEHITGTYKKLRKHLETYSEEDRTNALIFLTVLYIGVFDNVPIDRMIKNVARGYYTAHEQVIIDHAIDDLQECARELANFRVALDIQN
ncbi:MAG: hypothetical protein QW561_02990 [Candidatus Aenigmatarchaeota archaeon]